jgi:hypothetical protein
VADADGARGVSLAGAGRFAREHAGS